jgi:hypothetical protein
MGSGDQAAIKEPVTARIVFPKYNGAAALRGDYRGLHTGHNDAESCIFV